MIDVTIQKIGRQLITIIMGAVVARNNLIKTEELAKAAQQATLQQIEESKSYFDKRYTATRQFFTDPAQASQSPIIKKTHLDQMQQQTQILYRNIETASNYNANLLKVRQQALLKGLRR